MNTKLFCALAAAFSLVMASSAAMAQSAAADKPASKTGKAAAAKKQEAAPKPRPRLARSAVKAVEEITPVDDDPNVKLSESDLEIAKRVYVGHIACELGASVQITPARKEGFFIVQTKGARYLMHPVESRTGALRLEDPRRGALWLQLGNKSMLMSQKLGLRLADECMSTEQVTFADQMKKNPPRSLLEPAEAPKAAASAGDPPAGAPSARTP
jgi:Ni/Co efflux regulator RcnB